MQPCQLACWVLSGGVIATACCQLLAVGSQACGHSNTSQFAQRMGVTTAGPSAAPSTAPSAGTVVVVVVV